ncbi:MAG: VWA domain-containing protein [Candidatus Levyibacteriota bacterium]
MKRKTVRKRLHKTRKHHIRHLKVFFQKGSITLYLLLAVIIAGAFFLAGGIPSFNFSPTDNTPAGQPVLETPDPQRNDLQLKTLKFKGCTTTTAIDFLIDTSGSMGDNNKLTNLEQALTNFSKNFNDSTVTGLRRFSASPNYCNAPITERLVPIDFYSQNKTQFSSAVGNLCPSGGTNTRTAFAAELADMQQMVTDQRFKDKNFNLIFLTDGIPEDHSFPLQGDCQQFVNSDFPVCTPYTQPGSKPACRCFDSSQDPTANPQIAQQIQALKSLNGNNVHIYALLVFDPVIDAPFKAKVDNMMTAIASTPQDYLQTTDPTQISALYGQIAQKICSSQTP